jgi:type 1 glutamine amidotransferase
MKRPALSAPLLLACSTLCFAVGPIRVLIVDGQNNHAWQQTTPALKKILESTGRFKVDVATSPPQGGDMSRFRPRFAAYHVVLSNYNGEAWSPETKAAFEEFVRNGGGFVSYHAADNAFPEWKEYQRMIAVGGWGGRTTQQFGPALRVRDGQTVRDASPAACGHHGNRLPFQITMRDPRHPIALGLPAVWMHAADELYDTLCGPAENVEVLATAHSDPANLGTNENEPMLMAIRYGKGRVFHTTLGHDLEAIQCAGFIVTLQRGTEWAATGRVTQRIPADFPSADQASTRSIR